MKARPKACHRAHLKGSIIRGTRRAFRKPLTQPSPARGHSSHNPLVGRLETTTR
jgi:hypothetical protein